MRKTVDNVMNVLGDLVLAKEVDDRKVGRAGVVPSDSKIGCRFAPSCGGRDGAVDHCGGALRTVVQVGLRPPFDKRGVAVH